MPLERLGFIPTISRYEVLWVFLQQLKEAVCSLPHIQGHLFSLDTTPENFFKEYSSFHPQALIVFNSLFAQPDGRLLCDFLKTPTLFYLVDSPFHFDITHSPYAWISCIDRGHCRYLEKRGVDRTLFLPHAVAKVNSEAFQKERPYGIVMLSSGIDYQKQYDKVFNALSRKGRECITEGLERWESNPLLTLDEALDPEIPSHLPRVLILKKLDLYLKGLKRTELLKALDGFQIDLFGGGDSWQEILGDSCPHVRVHGEVSFNEAIAIMQKAKIVLNNCASIRDGAHERIFQALAEGAAVAAERTPYLAESFEDDAGIAYYPDYTALKEKLALWLSDEGARVQAVGKGRKKLEEGQLWMHRAKQLVAALSSLD